MISKNALMEFNFMPFKLNCDLSHFKDTIQYISTDNGIELYKVRNPLEMPLLGIPVKAVNLYFFEGNLITAYIYLEEITGQLYKAKKVLEEAFLEKCKAVETDSGCIYYWQTKSQFLGLFVPQDKNIMLVYYSLNKFNVFK